MRTSNKLIILLLFPLSGFSKIIYVASDAEGTHDGRSWQNAYTELWEALDQSAYGDTIFIKEGTYFGKYWETLDGIPFTLPSGVKVFGGFKGIEVSLEERPFDFKHSVIKGLRKAFLCIDTDSSTIIDGLNISSNIAFPIYNWYIPCDWSEGDTRCFGGGIFIGSWDPEKSACLQIRNCIFELNEAQNAGGALVLYAPNSNSGLWVSNTIFRKNKCFNSEGGGSGGAIYLTAGAGDHYGFYFEDCLFEENEAIWYGGVFTAQGDWDVEFKNCTFQNNKAKRRGAALAKGSVSNAKMMRIKNCRFINNRTEPSRFYPGQGGAIFGEKLQIEHCLFAGNIARWGGAIQGTDLVISNTTFLDNYAGMNGGAVDHLTYGNAENMKRHVYRNCTFAGNRADSLAGAIYGGSVSLDTFTNCVFHENSAGLKGQNIYYWNSIKSLYQADYNYFGVIDTLDAIYEFFNNRDSAYFGPNNIFLDAKAHLGRDRTGLLRPGNCSSLIGKGSPELNLEYDLEYNKRPVDRPATLGALEPTPWIYEWKSQDATCFGYRDGKVWHEGEAILGPVLFSELSGESGFDTLFLNRGVYKVIAMDQAGCSDTITISIEGHQEIEVSDTMSHPQSAESLDGQIVIMDIVGEYPPFELVWSNGETGWVNLNLPVGYYFLSITDDIGCEKVVEYELSFNSSYQTTELSDMKIWPNPAEDLVFVTSGSQISSWKLSDLSGRVIGFSQNLNQNRLEVDIQALQAGMYLLYVHSETSNSQGYFKIVKQ